MEVPTYEEFMLPVLMVLKNGNKKAKKDIFIAVSNETNLSEEQKEHTLPSQTMPTYINRIGWALTYLKKAGLISSPERAVYQITNEGLKVLDNKPVIINNKFLSQYSSFNDFKTLSGNRKRANKEALSEESPDEIMQTTYEIIKQNICDELLNKILENSPYSFEKLVVDLIVSMGYGGNQEDAGQATKKSGDGGIDGVINEDKLGLGKIYLQAKRYEPSHFVGSPEIQAFIGALQIQGAKKGIFITTSDFSKPAIDLLSRNSNIPVALINGKKLVELMYEYDLGVSSEKIYKIKKLDTDYFESFF